jgi:hypothetical protein
MFSLVFLKFMAEMVNVVERIGSTRCRYHPFIEMNNSTNQRLFICLNLSSFTIG